MNAPQILHLVQQDIDYGREKDLSDYDQDCEPTKSVVSRPHLWPGNTAILIRVIKPEYVHGFCKSKILPTNERANDIEAVLQLARLDIE